MKKREDKRKDVDSLHGELGRIEHLFVAGFEKLKVDQDFELRKAVRGAGGRYRVVKNNLAEKAAEGTKTQDLLRGLVGMTSLAYTERDPVALAKALTGYAKNNPSFTFKAGMVEGRAIDIRTINELASLPSREEMLSKLLFLIQAPAQRLVSALGAVGRNLAVTIDQGCKENKFSV
jgi:large subunit ribosomal protein L10